MIPVLLSMFGQGILHGLGPDHCLAIAALISAGGGIRRALAVSLRFGVGHSVVLAVGSLLASATGFVVPLRWESALEVVGGVSLLLLGCFTLLSRPSLPHTHGDVAPHRHDAADHGHDEETTPPWAGWRFQMLVGGLFGLSGVRGLLMVLPLVGQRSAFATIAGIFLFGAGVVGSMFLVGALAGGATATAARRWELGLRIPLGLASVCCGAFWVVDHVA